MQSGALQVELLEALLAAFPESYELDIAAREADLKQSVSDYLAARGTPYRQGLFLYLNWIEAQNLLVRFLKKARKANPGNPDLGRVMAKLAALETRFADLRPLADDGRTLTFEEAESIVLQKVRFEDVGPWLDTLGKMRRAVCRVEPQPQSEGLGGYGTGYLVAPDVVMTNFHVAGPFWSSPERAKRVRVRFDYESGTSGVGVGRGKEYALRMEWPSGTSASADRPHPWQCLSSPVEQLDFALLRLASPAGDDQVGAAARSFLTLTPRSFTQSDPVMILQHPQAEPMKLSFGSVTDVESTRVKYKVNTQGGSSGSPCLSQDLKVTAIHHYGETDRNRGIPHEAILAFLGEKENRERLRMLGLERVLPQ
jgi:V8-like Glu-specific endopeptidase